jgi:hypothetical protein
VVDIPLPLVVDIWAKKRSILIKLRDSVPINPDLYIQVSGYFHILGTSIKEQPEDDN